MLIKRYLLAILLGVQLLVTIFYASNLSNVKYSYIGDEFTTYLYAKQIAIGEITPNLFSLNGVFKENPVLGSYYQAAVMKVFGTDIYSWKLASLLIIFPLGLVMFYLIKRVGNIPTAFFALFATDSSFYFYNFFQIGYLNNISLLCLVIILYLVTVVDKKNEKKSFIPYLLLGITLSLSWYFYIGKLFILIISIYLLLRRTNNLKQLGFVLIPAIFLISISFIATPTHDSDLGLAKTILHKEFTDNTVILHNIFYPFILHHYSPLQTHYLPRASYVDTITASMATIGFLLILLSFFTKKFRRFTSFHTFLLLFLLFAFTIGITTPYSLPPVTRGIHFLPFYIIFAAYCLLYVSSLLEKQKTVVLGIVAILTFGIIVLNLLEIAKPLPMDINQQLLLFLQQQSPTNIMLVKSKNCINLVNLETAAKTYTPSHTIQTVNSLRENSCAGSKLIFTCMENVCGKQPEKSFEDRLFLYRL